MIVRSVGLPVRSGKAYNGVSYTHKGIWTASLCMMANNSSCDSDELCAGLYKKRSLLKHCRNLLSSFVLLTITTRCWPVRFHSCCNVHSAARLLRYASLVHGSSTVTLNTSDQTGVGMQAADEWSYC